MNEYRNAESRGIWNWLGQHIFRHVVTFFNKVGIGVYEPVYTLDVDGDINITGDYKVNGTNIGVGLVGDHGALTGLGDDDHTQYHNDTRGDARYSLSGHNHSGTYSPVANGVTNGDSHDHSGGDGGQIHHGGLSGLSDDDHTQYHNNSRGDARYLRVYDVKLYGAIGDGVTDDREAIRDAIDACEAAGGGIVLFPPGSYYVDASIDLHHDLAPIEVRASNVSLFIPSGARLWSDKQAYGSVGHLICLCGDWTNEIPIENVHIYGGGTITNTLGSGASQDNTLALSWVDGFSVTGMRIHQSDRYAITAQEYIRNGIISRNIISDSKFCGIGIGSRAPNQPNNLNISILGNIINDTGLTYDQGRYGILADSVDNLLIEGNTINGVYNATPGNARGIALSVQTFSGTASGNGNVGGTTVADSGLTQADDYFNGLTMYITSGTCNGQGRVITDYQQGVGFTVSPAFSAQILSGVTYGIYYPCKDSLLQGNTVSNCDGQSYYLNMAQNTKIDGKSVNSGQQGLVAFECKSTDINLLVEGAGQEGIRINSACTGHVKIRAAINDAGTAASNTYDAIYCISPPTCMVDAVVTGSSHKYAIEQGTSGTVYYVGVLTAGGSGTTNGTVTAL